MRTYEEEMGLLVVLAKGIMLMMFGDLFLEDLLVLTSHLGLHILYKSNGFHPLMAIRRSAFSRWKSSEMPRNRGAYSRQDGPQFQLRSPSTNQDWQAAM